MLFEHGFVNVAGFSFPGLRGFFHVGHGGKEGKVGILFPGLGHLIEEGGVFGPVIGVEENELLWKLVARGLQDDRASGRDADASSEKDRWDAGVFMEDEFAPGGFKIEFGAEWDGLQGALEGGVAHTGCDDEVLLVGRAGEGEAAFVSFCVCLWRIGEGEVASLTWDEYEAMRLFKVKGHCSNSNLFSAFQLDLLGCQRAGPFF